MSFQIAISPTRRAAARLIADVRRSLQRALFDEKVTQSYIADKIGVGRAVVNRQLKGNADLSLSRVGEIAEILGYDADFVLRKREEVAGNNAGVETNISVRDNINTSSGGDIYELTTGYKTVEKAAI